MKKKKQLKFIITELIMPLWFDLWFSDNLVAKWASLCKGS